MIKELKIGETSYNARPSALTEVIYRNVFGKDLKTELSVIAKDKKTETSIFKELAFVMIWQAKPRDQKIGEAMKRLSIDDYYEWLDEIDERGFLNAETLANITNLWLASNASIVTSKN